MERSHDEPPGNARQEWDGDERTIGYASGSSNPFRLSLPRCPFARSQFLKRSATGSHSSRRPTHGAILARFATVTDLCPISPSELGNSRLRTFDASEPSEGCRPAGLSLTMPIGPTRVQWSPCHWGTSAGETSPKQPSTVVVSEERP